MQVNGRAVTVDVDDPDTPLLHVLRAWSTLLLQARSVRRLWWRHASVGEVSVFVGKVACRP
jgi:hypothetical protein